MTFFMPSSIEPVNSPMKQTFRIDPTGYSQGKWSNIYRARNFYRIFPSTLVWDIFLQRNLTEYFSDHSNHCIGAFCPLCPRSRVNLLGSCLWLGFQPTELPRS